MTRKSELVDAGAVVGKFNPSSEVMALRDDLAAAKADLKRYRKAHGGLETMLAGVLEAVQEIDPQPVLYAPEKGRRVSAPCDLAVHLSDLHYGAVQDPDEVEGFGVYSPDIAKARLRNFVKDVLNWVAIQRTGYTIPRCHVLFTGDLVSGDIHEELRVTNAFPAPVQAVEAGVLMAEIVQALAPHFAEVKVHFVTDDNHGRLTRKPQAKEGGLNNFGYVGGSIMQKLLAAQKNVSVNLITRPWDSVDCNGRRYLLTHGHHVMGWAGFPYYGIERLVAREALKRMNAADIRKFHKVVLGHWHAPLAHPWYWIGGSCSGTDAFDHGQGRHAEPQQVTWLIHPRHGEFARTEWTLHEGG